MTPIKPTTAKDRARLEAFLSRPSHPEGTLLFGELRGFLFALAAAPELVKPSEWIPFIFAGEEPEFETLEEVQEVLRSKLPLRGSDQLDQAHQPALSRARVFLLPSSSVRGDLPHSCTPR